MSKKGAEKKAKKAASEKKSSPASKFKDKISKLAAAKGSEKAFNDLIEEIANSEEISNEEYSDDWMPAFLRDVGA